GMFKLVFALAFVMMMGIVGLVLLRDRIAYDQTTAPATAMAAASEGKGFVEVETSRRDTGTRKSLVMGEGPATLMLAYGRPLQKTDGMLMFEAEDRAPPGGRASPQLKDF